MRAAALEREGKSARGPARVTTTTLLLRAGTHGNCTAVDLYSNLAATAKPPLGRSLNKPASASNQSESAVPIGPRKGFAFCLGWRSVGTRHHLQRWKVVPGSLLVTRR